MVHHLFVTLSSVIWHLGGRTMQCVGTQKGRRQGGGDEDHYLPSVSCDPKFIPAGLYYSYERDSHLQLPLLFLLLLLPFFPSTRERERESRRPPTTREAQPCTVHCPSKPVPFFIPAQTIYRMDGRRKEDKVWMPAESAVERRNPIALLYVPLFPAFH